MEPIQCRGRPATLASVCSVVALASVLAGCGAAETPVGDELPDLPPSSDAPNDTASDPTGLAADRDVQVCEPSPFLDAPMVDPPQGLDEQIPAWVNARPDELAGVWWDSAAGQFVVVAVDPDAAQAAIDDEFGDDVPVRVERGARSDTELAALQDRVAELAQYDLFPSAGRRVWDAKVEIGLEFLNEPSLAAVREVFAGDLDSICVTGADPSMVPPDGPQPTEGDGWRLLRDEVGGIGGVGEPYSADVALGRQGYEAMWNRLGLAGDPPDVDFDREIVLWFGAVFSGSCPEIRLDDVAIDPEASTVTAEIVQLGGNRDCTADANLRSYVVALSRDRLPAVPFTVSPYPDCRWCIPAVVAELIESDMPTSLSEEDLTAIMGAASHHRVMEDNSFGGGSPFDTIDVVETVGDIESGGGAFDMEGRALSEAERAAIVEALAPLAVEFVPATIFDDLDIWDPPERYAILSLGDPGELDATLTIWTSLWCGGLCGIGGANELIRHADGSWSIGDPVGPQYIS